MESCPKKWRYGIPKEDQPKLQPLLEGLERLRGHGLTTAVVVVAFHRRRVLPLMAQRWRLFEIRPDEPIEGIRMSASTLSDEEILHWGMRDVRASPPPIPEDAARRAVNQAHAETQKRRKDAKEAKRTRKILACEGLEKRRRQQRYDSLRVESSSSPSLSTDASNGDDESEMGRGPLDHLLDVGEMAPRVSVSSPALPGGGAEDALRPAIARPEAEADTPEARAFGKCTVSPVGSTVEVEQVAAGVTQLPPQRTKGVPESSEGRPAPTDTEAVPPPPPPPLQRRVTVPKWFHPRSSRKRKAEVPALALRKSLKGEVTGVATERAGEETPTPCEAKARESDGAKAPLVAEATEGETEAPRTFEAKATEAGAPRTTEAEVAGTGAPETTEAGVAGTGAPETAEAGVAGAGVSATKLAAQEVEAEAGQASIPPPVQGPPPLQESAREVEVHLISFDDTSRAKEVVDAEAASTMEQPAPTSGEGSSALMRVRPKPHEWDHPRVRWQSRDDPEGEPLFALEDVAEGGARGQGGR
ncbi:uncharacterized protein [Miscanthus floridulus]|uniref:uncharacterized protein n=1 Tax=Miscanthus floridulus TaxID=154761 RepID=UPI003459957C